MLDDLCINIFDLLEKHLLFNPTICKFSTKLPYILVLILFTVDLQRLLMLTNSALEVLPVIGAREVVEVFCALFCMHLVISLFVIGGHSLLIFLTGKSSDILLNIVLR